MVRKWRDEIKYVDGQLENAKEYFKSAKEKYIKESVYTKRISSNGAVSLMKTDKSFLRMKSNVVKKLEMDSFLLDVDDLPNYYHLKSSIERLMGSLVVEVQNYQKIIRDRIEYLEGHYLKEIYRKRRDLYESYMQSEEWRVKRKEVLSIKGDRCFLCNDKYDDIHHLHYKSLGDECPKNDLEPVCRQCHKKIHGIDTDEVEEQGSNYWDFNT